mmetsp:Transcript_19620/g.46854  ORF Transcript_19620/g.46854 Transcript_19620/m.46854 type:complete len:89 (-) Transcript_19620:1233-1499(-)
MDTRTLTVSIPSVILPGRPWLSPTLSGSIMTRTGNACTPTSLLIWRGHPLARHGLLSAMAADTASRAGHGAYRLPGDVSGVVEPTLED